MAKELSKEGSKESVVVISLELSLDKSLAKGPRNLRCCHLDGLNLTDQCKVVAYLIYNGQCLSMPVNASSCRSLPVIASRCRSMPVDAGRCRSMPVSIYKTGIYLMLVSLIQTIKMTTSKGSWALAKELSKESSKEITTTDSLEPSLDNSLAKVPRMLRCCHLDGLNQTDQHKVDASLIYDWH